MEPEDTLLIMPRIEAIISRKRVREQGNTIDIGEEKEDDGYIYLAKFFDKSYHRCQWFTEFELSQHDYALDRRKKKSMWIRITRTKKLRLQGEYHFNPSFLLPDRILASTDLFSAIQPKKVLFFTLRPTRSRELGKKVCNWSV